MLRKKDKRDVSCHHTPLVRAASGANELLEQHTESVSILGLKAHLMVNYSRL